MIRQSIVSRKLCDESIVKALGCLKLHAVIPIVEWDRVVYSRPEKYPPILAR